jgi:hypothetical protein
LDLRDDGDGDDGNNDNDDDDDDDDDNNNNNNHNNNNNMEDATWDLGVGGLIILKWILKKLGLRMWARLI